MNIMINRKCYREINELQRRKLRAGNRGVSGTCIPDYPKAVSVFWCARESTRAVVLRCFHTVAWREHCVNTFC